MAVVVSRAAALLAVFSIACASPAVADDSAMPDEFVPFQVATLDFSVKETKKPEKSDMGFAAKWSTVEREMRAEMREVARCRAEPETCTPAARKFIKIVDVAGTREGRARIGEINRAVNLSIKSMSDMAQHGVADLWTSPLKTFASGAGDCEDYAIAKFAALREVGFTESDLRLLVVHEAGADSYHAVVSVRLDDNWLVLDNRRLAMMDEKVFPARTVLALQADSPKVLHPEVAKVPRADDQVVVAALDGVQNFGGWSAPPLLM
jgi:predicted transglutaminase-like cysteine proteinase